MVKLVHWKQWCIYRGPTCHGLLQRLRKKIILYLVYESENCGATDSSPKCTKPHKKCPQLSSGNISRVHRLVEGKENETEWWKSGRANDRLWLLWRNHGYATKACRWTRAYPFVPVLWLLIRMYLVRWSSTVYVQREVERNIHRRCDGNPVEAWTVTRLKSLY